MVDPPAVSGSEQDLLLRPSMRKWTLLVGVGLAFTVIGVWMIWDGEGEGWFVALFFGACLAVGLLNFVPGSAYLRLTKDGFRARSLWRRFEYRWSDVEDFRVFNVSGNALVVFNVTSPTKRSLVESLSKNLSGGHAGLPDTYGLKAQALADLMNQWKAASETAP